MPANVRTSQSAPDCRSSNSRPIWHLPRRPNKPLKRKIALAGLVSAIGVFLHCVLPMIG